MFLSVMGLTEPVASTTSLALMKLAPLTVMPRGLAMIKLALCPAISTIPAKEEAVPPVNSTSFRMTEAPVVAPPKLTLAGTATCEVELQFCTTRVAPVVFWSAVLAKLEVALLMIAAVLLLTLNLVYWLCEMPLASGALISTQLRPLEVCTVGIAVPVEAGTIKLGSAACAALNSNKAVIVKIPVPLPLTAPRAISLTTIKRPSILLRTIR